MTYVWHVAVACLAFCWYLDGVLQVAGCRVAGGWLGSAWRPRSM